MAPRIEIHYAQGDMGKRIALIYGIGLFRGLGCIHDAGHRRFVPVEIGVGQAAKREVAITHGAAGIEFDRLTQ